ncbi:MAG: hypothetical protein ING56_08400 [Rhodocyclaceae bacterium]|nr:hypothetical protein [Rhodocyclaceae bacterium]
MGDTRGKSRSDSRQLDLFDIPTEWRRQLAYRTIESVVADMVNAYKRAKLRKLK